MSWRRSKVPLPAAADIERIIDANVALASGLDAPGRVRLVELTTEIIGLVHWESLDGLVLGDEVRVTISANAAFPVLALDLQVYRQVRAVIVRPTVAALTGVRAGPMAGTVTDDPLLTSGVAMGDTGPLALSWDVALAESRWPWSGSNLVIHEFAHKIDMSDGYSDGTPPLRGDALIRWSTLLNGEFESDQSDVTPQPDDVGRVDSVLREYAWTNRAEFFAVATESFFCTPGRLRAGKPALYQALRDFYRQDPAGERLSRFTGEGRSQDGRSVSA